jgi:hypothetical protein
VDVNGTTITPGNLNSSISSATTTNIVGSPTTGTSRNVEEITIYNNGAAAEQVTLELYDGTTTVKVFSISLGVSYTIVVDKNGRPTVYDASGNIQQSLGQGRWLRRTVLTSTVAATAFTFSTNTNNVVIRGVGGGGQGGGCAATTGCVGSGGGSGAYLEYVGSVSPSGACTYQCGTGGTTGGTGANGQAGANSTFTLPSSTVLTCPGGGGGLEGTAIALNTLGGAPGAVATNGTLNCGGEQGYNGSGSATAADTASGGGAASALGGGAAGLAEAGNATGNSAATLGYGGGGGGAATSAATARAGGAGAQGCWIVDEYS